MDKNAADLYRSLGVNTVVNAAGPISIYGGGRSRPEVIEAMSTAFPAAVQINELNLRAGEIIADILGVEAAFVSSGAAGGHGHHRDSRHHHHGNLRQRETQGGRVPTQDRAGRH